MENKQIQTPKTVRQTENFFSWERQVGKKVICDGLLDYTEVSDKWQMRSLFIEKYNAGWSVSKTADFILKTYFKPINYKEEE
jgi:hypothetical protein